jgi:hypothetical protein
VIVTGAVQEAIPVNTSAQLKVTVGCELCQPDAFAAGVTVAVMVGGVVSGRIVAPKLAARVTESKYTRRPAAVLRPPHGTPWVSVPIRVFNLTNSISLPSNEICENGVKEIETSLALPGFAVTPVRHRVMPEEIRVLFLYTSA